MHLFTNQDFLKDSLIIDGEDFYHLTKALRKRVGDTLTVVSTVSDFYIVGSIFSLGKKQLELRITHTHQKPKLALPKIVLYQALVKRNKMEVILQKATELGVDKIVPVISKNVVPDKPNLERWNTILREASMQSRRFFIPELAEPLKLNKIIAPANPLEQIATFAEKGSTFTYKQYLMKLAKDLKSLSLIVGPEGGFTAEEFAYIKAQDIPLLSLGSNILRAETASIVVLGIAKWFFEV